MFWQNRELLEEARAAKCYRDELDIVKEKVSEFIFVLWLRFILLDIGIVILFEMYWS